MVEQIFFSPQVGRYVIISNKLVYKHELPNNLRLRIFWKIEIELFP